MSAASLVFDLFAKDHGVEKSFDKISDKAGGLGNVLGKVAGAAGKLAAPIAAGVAAFKTGEFIKKSTEEYEQYIGTVGKLSRVTGLNTESASKLSAAIQMSGLDAQTAGEAMTKFSEKMGAAAKTPGELAKMTAELGFSVEDATGKLLPMDALLPKVADKFKSMPDGPEKTALAVQLFGKQGAELLPMLNKGSAGMAQFGEQAQKMGLVVSDANRKFVADAKKSHRDYAMSMQGLKIQTGAALLPVIDSFQDVGRKAVTPLIQAITHMVMDVQKPLMDFAEHVEKMGEKARGAVNAFLGSFKSGTYSTAGDIESRMGHLGAEFSGIFSRVQSVVTTVFNVAHTVVDDFFIGFKTGTYSATDGIFGRIQEFGAIFSGAFSAVQSVVSDLFGKLKGAFAGIDFGAIVPQILGVAQAFSPVHYAIEAILPVLPQLLGVLGQLAGSVGTTLLSTFRQIAPVILDASKSIGSLLSGALVQLLPMVVSLIGTLGQALSTIIPVVGQVVAAIVPLVSQLLQKLIPIVVQLVQTILPPVIQIFMQIVNQAIVPLIQILAAVLVPVIQALLPVITTVFGVVANIITSVMTIVMGVINVVLGIITGNWDQVWSGIQQIFAGIWDTIVAVLQGAWNILTTYINSGLNLLSGVWNSIWGGISSFLSDTWNNIVAAVSLGIQSVLGFIGGIQGQIMSALSGAAQWLVDVGTNIVQGLINGISSMISNVISAVTGIGGAVMDTIKTLLGIHSPSRVFHGYGQNIVEGLVNGISSGHGDVRDAMGRLSSVATGGFSGLNIGADGAAASYTPVAPVVHVYVGNDKLESHMYRVAGSAIDDANNRAGRRPTR